MTINKSSVINIDEIESLCEDGKENSLMNKVINWNSTEANYPDNKTIEQLFQDQVMCCPDAVAIVDGNRSLTYLELNKLANKLARHILKVLESKNRSFDGDLIALYIDRSCESIISLLAILKAGKAYLPLDHQYPSDRLNCIINDANISTIITKYNFLDKFQDKELGFILLDSDEEAIDHQSDENLFLSNNIDKLAYVNYTSGSTGKPKGVEITHRGVNRLLFGANYVKLDSENVFLQISSMAFDAATFEVWGALLHGGKCILFCSKYVTLKNIEEYILKHEINILFLTTALFNTIVDEKVQILSNILQLFFGGEANSIKHVRKALNELPHTELISVYGPTEATTFATWYPVKNLPKKIKFVPIGKPISNTKVYLLNEFLTLVEIGEVGEIYIAGPGLARGYVNNEIMTKEKFIHNNLLFGNDNRFYKTGDLGRYLFDGNLEFVGRTDNQVKINGFRIELSEIQFVLSDCPGVRQAVVFVDESKNHNKKLIAFVIMDNDQIHSDRIKKYLQEKLPIYMIPGQIFCVSSFPMTVTGKVDRNALLKLINL